MTVIELWKIANPCNSRVRIDFDYYDKRGVPIDVNEAVYRKLKNAEVLSISSYCVTSEPTDSECNDGLIQLVTHTLRLGLTLNVNIEEVVMICMGQI